MAEWKYESRQPQSNIYIFFNFSSPKHKILKGPPAFQPNIGLHLKKLERVKLQEMEPGPEKGEAKFGTMLGKTSTPGGHSCPFSAFGGRRTAEACEKEEMKAP